MTNLTIGLLLAFLIGVVSGLRTLTAPAAVSWAARAGWIHLESTAVAFLAFRFTPLILTVLALGELVGDKRPTTPSRKIPIAFAGRLVSGGLSGAAIGASRGVLMVGLIAGIAGAVAGTLGGSSARGALATAFGSDLPAAVLEDAIAIGSAAWIVAALR